MKRLALTALLLAGIAIGSPAGAQAAPSLAVLEFELQDLTALPNKNAGHVDIARFKPLFEQALAARGVTINAASGAGAYYDDVQAAADRGRRQGAQWALAGRHAVPSFLFSYLSVIVVDSRQPQRNARFDIELKGADPRLAERGVKTLAEKVARYLANAEPAKAAP